MLTPAETISVEMRLTMDEAYRAMFEFLDVYYARTGSDEVGGLLGSLAINRADGEPMDPAMRDDWLDAVARVLAGSLTDQAAYDGSGSPTTRNERVEVDLVSTHRAAAKALAGPFPSRRGRRRAQREVQEVVQRLDTVSRDLDLTVAIWRETTRDARFGFATGVRWHALAFTGNGDRLAAVRDVMPAQAHEVARRLLEQLEAR